ncbi:cytochrome c oxidase subunit 7A, mitochondrial [Homalodisca vitripennis]|uniref:cytochrome c oxidase subunit 7A, mitochondrial n=1 Tax=Homalodisca vitripennis TaxID=197043 RepID=UPI001EEC31C1|nr:cytochrome c oxidase subunit 7A, mitochondrial [Homalodisca vitripennis]
MSSRRVLQVVTRQFSTSLRRTADEVHPKYKELFTKQEQFQKPDGKPVHLKGGGLDGFMYRGTMGLCVVALVCNFALYYNLSFKK